MVTNNNKLIDPSIYNLQSVYFQLSKRLQSHGCQFGFTKLKLREPLIDAKNGR